MDKVICETSRLILREFRETDLDGLMEIFGDPEVMGFSIAGVKSKDDVRRLIASAGRLSDRDGLAQWAVILRATGVLIGECGILPQVMGGKREYEITYRFAKCHWGQGYATGAAIACREYGFNVRSLPRLISIIEAENQRSIRVAERVGMAREAEAIFHNIQAKVYSLRNPVSK
jgi:[ribosomal protein S5]-alanine N-acetyltransferase